MRTNWLMVGTALLVLALPARAAELLVDQAHPAASDAGPGTAEAPFKSVAKATAAAGPGDTVTVRPGIYRESVNLRRGGEEDRPLTIRASGPGAVLSGADAVGGWAPCAAAHPHREQIRQAAVAWSPAALFVSGRRLPVAREPDEGWWLAAGGGTTTVVDPAHLGAEAAAWVGGQLFLWDVDVTTQHLRRITGHAAATGEVQLDGPIYRDRTVQAGADRYRVENRLALIDQPGEWACQDGLLYLWPPDGVDLQQALVEAPRRDRFVIEWGGVSHVVLEGLEIRHGAAYGVGGWSGQPSDLTLRRCWVHDNLNLGVYVRNVTGARIIGNLVTGNENGVALMTCRDALVEANEVAWNQVDGLVCSHDSAQVTVRRNFLHDHTRWGHPDNLQVHNRVKGLRIEENVLLNGGQSIMMEATEDGVITGNLVIGSDAVALIFGHGNTHRYEVTQNTVAFCGYGGLSFSGQACRMAGNVIYPGTSSSAFSVATAGELTSDYNVVFRPAGLGGALVAYGRSWPARFEDYQKSSGQDAHSTWADPRFVNAPLQCGRVESRRLMECTADRMVVVGSRTLFAVGDPVELDFDGVPRRVVEVGDDVVRFEPALPGVPEKAGLLLNWRGRQTFDLDLRLAPDSPARGAGPDGRDAGANLDLAAFRRGDVDGDGTIDIRRPE